jgi:hypothetical protein
MRILESLLLLADLMALLVLSVPRMRAWVRPDGRKAYFVGHVKKLSHEFLP